MTTEYVVDDYWLDDYAEGEAAVGCYIVDDADYWAADYAECSETPPVETTDWGTFPRRKLGAWWPSPRKRPDEDFAEKVERIVEPLPEAQAEVVRELSQQIAADRVEVEQLRPMVAAKMADEELKFTKATKEAVAKIEVAAAQREQEVRELQRQQKEQRTRNAIKILKMLH